MPHAKGISLKMEECTGGRELGNRGLTLEMEGQDREVQQEVNEISRIVEGGNDFQWGRM